MMSPARRQGGIALVLVMWALALLTVMALSLTLSQRTESALSDNHVAAARFRMLADAAIAYAALHFVETTPTDSENEPSNPQWLPDGTPRLWHFAEADLAIAIFNESSRIDLNQTDESLLSNLLKVLGVEDEQATALAAAIVDWRDEDDLVTLNGAEDAEYRAAGHAIGAKDEPFSAVEELRQVLGMTEEIYRRLSPEVTVDTNGDALDEDFASPAVLAASQGISLEEAGERVAERNEPVVPGAESAGTRNRGGPFYRVRVTQQQGEAVNRMEALIELTPAEDSPYRVRWRRFGLRADETPIPRQNQG